LAVSDEVLFAALLRKLRTAAGLTQEELAEAARLSYRSISDLERGINLSPRKETMRLLADALKLGGAERAAFEAAAKSRGQHGRPTGHPAPAVGGLATATRTLPRDITSFTGREPELGRLIEAATQTAEAGGTVGIYAVGGMAGIGKTTFAVHAAHLLAGRFPDGQIFLPLHGHTPGQQPVDPAEALASLLQTAGVAAQQVPRGLEARARLWRDYLFGKRMLIVLDDAARTEQVRPLLPGTAGSLVLITSRRHLTALEDAQAVSLDTLPPADAAQLFVRLARCGLDPRDPAVAEITRLSGYLPIAVSMLASQLHHHPGWTVSDLAADLAAARDRLAMMTTEDVSVAAAFGLSYRDLDASLQQTFRRLGLHPGTAIDLWAAAALTGHDLAATRRQLEALYDQHLLIEPSHGRYRMHDLIREHARDLAAADSAADRESAADRLLGYYTSVSRSANRYLARWNYAAGAAGTVGQSGEEPVLRGGEDAVAWMNTETSNLYAAVEYASANGRPAVAIAISAAVHGFLRRYGKFQQAIRFSDVALAAARGAGDQQAEARSRTELGDMQRLSGHYPAAIDNLSRAVELYRTLGERQGEANALNELAAAHYLSDSYPAATEELLRALRLYRDLGDQLGEAHALNHLGAMHHLVADYQAAVDNQTHALKLYRELGYLLGEANATIELGLVQYLTGDYRAAVTSLGRGLELARALGYRTGEADALVTLGAVQLETGDRAEAAASLGAALARSKDLGYRVGEASALHYLAVAQYQGGDQPGASRHIALALAIYRELGDRLGEARTLNVIGETSPPADAVGFHRQALDVATQMGAPIEQARAREGIGRCHLRQGQPELAGEPLRQALAIYRRTGSPRAGQVEQTLRDRGMDQGERIERELEKMPPRSEAWHGKKGRYR
jgi:tetratricopeptide (TPR) repeat protein/transcriptional regulator with XRE-family HTH domain